MTFFIKDIINIDSMCMESHPCRHLVKIKMVLKNKKEITNILNINLINNDILITNEIYSFLEYDTEVRMNGYEIYRKLLDNHKTMDRHFQSYADYEPFNSWFNYW